MAGGDANKRNYKPTKWSRFSLGRETKSELSRQFFLIFVYSKTKTDWKNKQNKKESSPLWKFRVKGKPVRQKHVYSWTEHWNRNLFVSLSSVLIKVAFKTQKIWKSRLPRNKKKVGRKTIICRRSSKGQQAAYRYDFSNCNNFVMIS